MKDEPTLQQRLATSYLSGGSAAYIEDLYETYLRDKAAVPTDWRAAFDALPAGTGLAAEDVSHAQIRQQFLMMSKSPRRARAAPSGDAEWTHKQACVLRLISAYRAHGHHRAKLDPLRLASRVQVPDLELAHQGLTDQDLETVFNVNTFLGADQDTSLRDLYDALNETYCQSIGVEYMHISSPAETRWIQERLEFNRGRPSFSADTKRKILKDLTAANGLEKYLGSRYVGQKRFSLEGGDSLIPALDQLIQHAGEDGLQEVVIGMAHRGRLNVLVNILGKSPEELFKEFEGLSYESKLSGDVKYHMGFSSDRKTNGGRIHVALSFNPSHLEIINPVVEGSVRARQVRRNDQEREQVLPVLIHGDAAFAGQGVVMETFSLSQARGFCTGGTVHIVVNNQIGFTTSNPLDARSTLYCTDVAKMVQAPIFHVNGDDPEAVVFVTQMALDYRMAFKKDVVIDLVCYRRHGHQEVDEPFGTQPLMYHEISQHPTPLKLYAKQLLAEKVVDQKTVDDYAKQYQDDLDAGRMVTDVYISGGSHEYAVDWEPYKGKTWETPADTRVKHEILMKLAERIEPLPEHFTLQAQVKKLREDRKKMTKGELPLDWGYAETMAYATLLWEGYPVRLCGQDARRGTFSHRHAVLHDFKTGEEYTPLDHVKDDQPRFRVIDSLLSEEAVLAFEYGYTLADPDTLIIWEAQFGDFANGAQVVIDQFISSAEQKWDRFSGIALFLPHGYEGQGPEHSSARLERYLQLCAQRNIQVCVPSTPAQAFHMIRRQMIRLYRKPLIVMSPKSLLRHKLAISSLEDLAEGHFHVVIPEVDAIKPHDVTRVIMCSGKVYYDLLSKRRSQNRNDVAILRIEQLYPFPTEVLTEALAAYKQAKDIVWCQEEPRNQGAWYCAQHWLRACLGSGQELRFAGRELSASPAAGYYSLHVEQQEALVKEALGEPPK